MFGGEDRDIIPDMEQFRVDKLIHPSPSVGLGPGVDRVGLGARNIMERRIFVIMYSSLLHGGLLVLSLELRESLILGIQLECLLYSAFSLGEL